MQATANRSPHIITRERDPMLEDVGMSLNSTSHGERAVLHFVVRTAAALLLVGWSQGLAFVFWSLGANTFVAAVRRVSLRSCDVCAARCEPDVDVSERKWCSRLVGRRSLAIVGVIACSSPTSSGSATVNGTVPGGSIVVNDVVGLFGTETINGVQSSYAGILISDTAGTCTAAQQGGVDAVISSNDLLEIGTKSSAIPFAPGTYTVGSAGLAEYFHSGSGNAGGGTITFSAVSDATVTGTFDVTLGGGYHVTGSFSGPVCSLPSTTIPFY